MTTELMRMISVNLGAAGQYELTQSEDGERIVILKHGEHLRVVGEFPPGLLPALNAFEDTYQFGSERMVSLRLPPKVQATVETQVRPDGKVDTIVTPVGLEVGAMQGEAG